MYVAMYFLMCALMYALMYAIYIILRTLIYINVRMKYGHFEMLRNGFNRHVDLKRVFAVWRIDAPWRPLHKKGK